MNDPLTKEITMKLFNSSRVCIFLLASLLFSFIVPVNAQETPGGIDHHFSIGAIEIAIPKYEGASSYKVRAFPLIDYHNQYVFVSMMKGIGINVIHTPTITMGPLISYRFERREKDSPLLEGLGNIKGGAEAGFFFDWQFHQHLSLEAKAMQGIGDAKGLRADVSLNYKQPIARDLFFGLQTTAQYANNDYNKQYFGITAHQSEQSGYERYSPGSGIKHVSIKPTLHYMLSDHYSVGLFYEYRRLTGPAADSPLVKKGSANQSMGGIGFTWTY